MDSKHLIALAIGATIAVVGAFTNHMTDLNPMAAMIIGGALGLAMPKGGLSDSANRKL